ncbi:ribbon-helix-helix domain-containing protein [Pseudomonas sp. MAG002Y]|uniref:ribbon-helix-helix domain-containing protein n=1 Tax=Pseudomonas sp. MAG002Y TaxID=2678690 RepID=UPI001C60834F|nr:ribbon-helix-helix domain-containing protein [Pseudomonas sp. MAG002Y]MBW5416302.1 hypothetical protein [Pseudomonas sp. MAG002Y]
MVLKKPSQAAAGKSATPEEADALARQLADKPYGEKMRASESVKKAKPLSISLPPDMIEQLEDTVRDNKRSGSGSRTISALIREALERNGYKSNN